MKEHYREILNKGIEKPPTEEGIIKETWMLDDAVVQIPKVGEEWRVVKIQSVAEKALEQEVQTPRPLDGSLKGPSYLVLERSEGKSLRSLAEDEREVDQQIFENVGSELAKIHQCEGRDYGFVVPGVRLSGEEESWSDYLEKRVDSALENTSDTSYELPAKVIASEVDLEVFPDPEPRLLHGDYSSENVMVDPETSHVEIIDWDNSLFGDPRFEFIQARRSIVRNWGDDYKEAFEKGYRNEREIYMTEEVRNSYLALAGLMEANIGAYFENSSELGSYEVNAQEILEDFQAVFSEDKKDSYNLEAPTT